MEKTTISGVIVSALKGGSGKTVLSLGLMACLKSIQKKISPFKKGPDYIDASWLALAAGQPCYNLDSFLINKKNLISSFVKHSINSDISIIEGNRGIFDGIDIDGLTSTAELAKLLNLPVILCLDCTKVTRTMVANIIGCTHFDPNLKIGGVILNQIAGPRHGNIVKNNIEAYTDIKVLGIMPRLKKQKFPERHMGLVPTYEHKEVTKAIEIAYKLVKDNVNLDEIINITKDAHIINTENKSYNDIAIENNSKTIKKKVKIAVCKDSVFQFYYEENLKELEKNGAELIFLSPLSDNKIPPIDAMYIGGGFPETNAKKLSQNTNFIKSLKKLIENELPVYAECGGLLYLSKEIFINGKSFKMLDVFPLSFDFAQKPQGHGYTIIKSFCENPFFSKNLKIKGHEFRYSKILKSAKNINMSFKVERGIGIKR